MASLKYPKDYTQAQVLEDEKLKYITEQKTNSRKQERRISTYYY